MVDDNGLTADKFVGFRLMGDYLPGEIFLDILYGMEFREAVYMDDLKLCFESRTLFQKAKKYKGN